MFLEISQNSEESTCARVAFLMKLQAKKETLTQVFSCEFCEISKNNFFNRTPLVAASENRYQTSLCAIAFLDYTCKSKNVTLRLKNSNFTENVTSRSYLYQDFSSTLKKILRTFLNDVEVDFKGVLRSYQISNMDNFVKIVNVFQSLTIFAK